MNRKTVVQKYDSFHNLFGIEPKYHSMDHVGGSKLIRPAQMTYMKERLKEATRESHEVELKELKDLEKRCQWEETSESKANWKSKIRFSKDNEEKRLNINERRNILRKLFDEEKSHFDKELQLKKEDTTKNKSNQINEWFRIHEQLKENSEKN